MVAPRDYYADLDLPPTAEAADIKKQYRKLALKYHPDRNPGREHEVNAQFLIIQTAHDILTNPSERAKFDATRGRSAPGKSSGVRGNPWADVGTQFPAPPRRTNAPGRGQASGADRWNTRFSSGVPPTARQHASAKSESMKNAAKAFESMRPKPQAKAGGSSGTRPSAAPPPTPPRTESARQRQQAAFGNRKTGYQPHASAFGDEPPVSNSNYTTRPDPSRTVPPRPTEEWEQPETQRNERPMPPPRMPDPLSQFRDNSGADGRQSSPYMAQSGEKTNPFDVDTSQGAPKVPPKEPHTRPSTSSTPRSQESPAPSPTEQKANGSQRPSMYGTPHKHRSQSYAHSPHKARGAFYTWRCYPFTESWAPQTSPSGERNTPRKQTSFLRDQHNLLEQLIAFASTTPEKRRQPHTSPTSQVTQSTANKRSISFSLSEETLPKTAPTHDFARKSADSINTSFTNEDKAQWQFNAGGQPAPDSAARSEESFTHQQQAEQPPQIPRKEPVEAPETKATPANEPFNPEGWSAQSWNETFAPPSRTNSNPSPLKASRANSRRTNPTKSGAGSTAKEAILVDSDEDEISFIGRGTRPSVASTGSPQAMDIDSPPVTGKATQGPRIVNVQPSRPEWRTDDHDGLPKGAGTTTARDSHLRNAEPNLNGAGSEDSAEFQANLADLRNVAPFANVDGTGLHSFGSMKDNLPFESKASETIPLEPKPVHTQPLVFPDAPLAPRPPPTMAVPGMPTNNGTWERYVGDFAEYLQKWEDFTGQVTDHFAARKTQIMGLRKEKGYGFLGARSDTDCLEYLKSVQQDNDVRSRWSAACDEHEQRLREFIACREKVR
ncbi:uncharacterized protein F5Z01DRAFT_632339 [Emericellopsis atlantica]|uniref:J domain-containing protein n=1 Tax=Emericellopsis atlantica TaxID=2614577 RepID=A0A9P7ZVU6_9HYPO|nr:uncharacterized protein F5Z01DRAFT_632339 [Emericellopsis atlantica]KAG9259268.1 hypothetical protein F5Z01DRAFT_632339 [Emericellopsis atlantica]